MKLRTRDVNDNMKWKEYDFPSFEVFYVFIQKLVPACDKLKSFKSFNIYIYYLGFETFDLAYFIGKEILCT